MKKTLPLLLLALAACSHSPKTLYDLELAYGDKGYLLLTVQEPGNAPAETYGLRLAESYYQPEQAKQDWQVFWGDKPPRYIGEKSSVTAVRKDPFILYSKGGVLHAARVPHLLKLEGGDLRLKRVISQSSGGPPLLEYGDGAIALDKSGRIEPLKGLRPVRSFRFHLPSEDLTYSGGK